MYYYQDTDESSNSYIDSAMYNHLKWKRSKIHRIHLVYISSVGMCQKQKNTLKYSTKVWEKVISLIQTKKKETFVSHRGEHVLEQLSNVAEIARFETLNDKNVKC